MTPLPMPCCELRLLGLHLPAAAAEGAAGAEELLQSGRQSLHLAVVAALLLDLVHGGRGGDGDVDHGGRDAGGDRFHGVVEGGECSYAVVVERRSRDGRGVHRVVVHECNRANGDGGRENGRADVPACN